MYSRGADKYRCKNGGLQLMVICRRRLPWLQINLRLPSYTGLSAPPCRPSRLLWMAAEPTAPMSESKSMNERLRMVHGILADLTTVLTRCRRLHKLHESFLDNCSTVAQSSVPRAHTTVAPPLSSESGMRHLTSCTSGHGQSEGFDTQTSVSGQRYCEHDTNNAGIMKRSVCG